MLQPARYDYDQAAQAAGFIGSIYETPPQAVVLAGTGLEDVTASARIEQTIDYDKIPHFPASTVQAHRGRLALGVLAGRQVIVMQGRFHLYEGYSARAVVFPIRVMRILGVKTLILSNAAGGLNPLYAVGDIMLIKDHINLSAANPLAGPHDERWGGRFPDMTQAYSNRLRKFSRCAASVSHVKVHSGIYAGLKGPSLETPAEMRFLRAAGADAVGFSTVLETIAGVQAGMRVVGISAITNTCRPDDLRPANVAQIIAAARSAAPRIEALITQVLEHLDA